ncbi:hypothetical protein D3C78_1040590 [compost metagenome]
MQVGITGTKVIDRDFISGLTESLNHRGGFRHINKSALSHFNLNLLSAHGILLSFIRDQSDEARRVEIGGRQVNGDIKMRVVPQKMPEIVKDLFNNIIGNPLDHALFFCQWNKLGGTHHLTIKTRPTE